ncbi:MAG: aminotransferase class I/II-fold pyridoxal phosphate-dependent enzyme [Cyanobacteria bacterium HKST-UBA02]|nr:aminotransferase class I/II-fold pyridoxal phosphate-dependent enzyme [Cyanobacteria bacterium HKST-UBA02]
MRSSVKSRGILPKKAVLSVSAYSAPAEGRLGSIRLDFNESTSPVECTYPEGLPASSVSAYPEYGELMECLSRVLDIPGESMMLTNGSDEAISLAANTFIEPGVDSALVSKPCFVMIPHCLLLAGAILDQVDVLPDLEFDIEGLDRALARKPRLAIFATPDNPTGSMLTREQIKTWCSDYPETLFVIDEAYGEFAGESVIDLIGTFENLLVLKTFSKAWGMAGLRLGLIAGNPELLGYIRRVQLPYSVNSAAVFTALRLLAKKDSVVERVQETVSLREQMTRDTNEQGYVMRETRANFGLLGAGFLAGSVCEFFKQKNILLRNRSNSVFGYAGSADSKPDPMWGYVRVSVGTAAEMDLYRKTLEEFGRDFAVLFDLDGTLVDTTESFDETVAYLVSRYSGRELLQSELDSLRLEGGFNDDWVAATELLRRRDVEIPLAEIAREGVAYYLSIAAERETMLIDTAILNSLRRKYPLYIVTGRTRAEYEPVWGERLDKLFEAVYCLDDVPGLAAKPSPDYLLKALTDSGARQGVYVGNSVDDMQAARAAGLFAFGFSSSSGAGAALTDAGAQVLLPSGEALAGLFMLPTSQNGETK